jgi:hypothetical protein
MSNHSNEESTNFVLLAIGAVMFSAVVGLGAATWLYFEAKDAPKCFNPEQVPLKVDGVWQCVLHKEAQ